MNSEKISFSIWTKDDIELAKKLWGNKEVTEFISYNGDFTNEQTLSRLVNEINNDNEFGIQYWPIFFIRF